MKLLISNILLWLLTFYFNEINSLKVLTKSFFSKSKTSIENKLSKYKMEINKYRKLNSELKNIKISGQYASFKNYYRKNFLKDDDNDFEEDVDLNIKILNLTFINDMDLIIKKTKFNKNFFVNGSNRNSTSDDVCYIKINMTLFNKSIYYLDHDNLNNHKSRIEDKDLKFDIDKINLIQKDELNKTKVVDKEVQLNNNLKYFLNNYIKTLNKTDVLKINSFVVKKLTNTNENSLSKRAAENQNNTSKENNNNTYNVSSESLKKVKKILNLETNKTNVLTITNITNYTLMKDVMNSSDYHKFHKQLKEKLNHTLDNSNENNNTEHIYTSKILSKKENNKTNAHSFDKDKKKQVKNSTEKDSEALKSEQNTNKTYNSKFQPIFTLKNISIYKNFSNEKPNNKIKVFKAPSEKTSNISNSTQNSTEDSDYSIVIYKITYPDEEDLYTLSYILSLQNEQQNYQKICFHCLDNMVFLKKLNEEIRKIKHDMFTFSTNSVFTRQELIVKFSDYINRVNLIKIQLFEMKTNLDLLKAASCSNFDDNSKYYDSIMKKANQLIEIIQDSIRKQNLNINFIVFT